MARISDIADALVTWINAGTYSQTITAVRRPLVQFRLEELKAGSKVSVVPRSVAEQNETRANNRFEYTIDIGIQAKLDDVTNTYVDPWLTLTEEIADRIRDCKPSDSRNTVIEINPIYATEHLVQYQQFTSVITATFVSRG